MSPEIIGLWMIAALLTGIFVGFPIAFTLIILGILFGYAGFGDTVFHLMLFQFFQVMREQTLASVPLFVFMGLLLEQAGLLERLFRSVQLALSAIYTGYALIRCYLNPALGPALPEEEHAGSRLEIVKEFLQGLVPPAVLVLASLGSILFGFATPTEGAAVGAAGSLLLVIAYRRLTWKLLYDAVLKTLEVSCLILFLVAASNFFGAVFSRLGTPDMMTKALLGLDVPSWLLLIVIMAVIFVLAWPLEWVPIVLIFLPILLPMVKELGFNLTWFGILVAVNLQTAWLSPPVALSAYFLKGVAPQWQLGDIYRGMVQFMLLQLAGLALVMMFPQIALWLPGVLYSK